MLAVAGEAFDSPRHLFEIKWDGIRALAMVDGPGHAAPFRLISRRSFEMRERYREFTALAALPAGTVLDGEVVVLENGKPSFPKLMQREQIQGEGKVAMLQRFLPATFIAFDILFDAGENVMKLPLSARKQRLAPRVAALKSPHVIVIDGFVEQGLALFKQVEAQGLEGLMAKRLDSPYQPGVRSPDWLKIKVAQSGDFDVLGYTPSTVKGMLGALLLGEPRKGGGGGRFKWDFKGKVGSGLTDEERTTLNGQFAAYPPLKNPPIKDVPADAIWKTTGLKCRVRYMEKTHTGQLRSPVFRGFVSGAADPLLPSAHPLFGKRG